MVWYVSAISRLIVGLALFFGGVAKSLNLSWFAATLGKYDLVPKTHLKKVGFAVAALEVAVGIGMIADLLLPWAAYVAIAMLIVFTGAICIALAKGKFNIACGCGSPRNKSTIGRHAILRNSGLIALSCLAAVPSAEPFKFGFALLFVSAMGLLAIAACLRGSSNQSRTQMQSSSEPNVAR